jgi:hypothetical protein
MTKKTKTLIFIAQPKFRSKKAFPKEKKSNMKVVTFRKHKKEEFCTNHLNSSPVSSQNWDVKGLEEREWR